MAVRVVAKGTVTAPTATAKPSVKVTSSTSPKTATVAAITVTASAAKAAPEATRAEPAASGEAPSTTTYGLWHNCLCVAAASEATAKPARLPFLDGASTLDVDLDPPVLNPYAVAGIESSCSVGARRVTRNVSLALPFSTYLSRRRGGTCAGKGKQAKAS